MKKYFLHDGSQEAGPFDIEELKAKNLNRDTPIWYEGLNEWTTIGYVEELKEIITSIPPPFATKIASPPPVEKTVTQTKAPADKPIQNSSTGRKLLILAGIVVIVIIGNIVYNQMQHQQAQNDRQNTINTEEDTKLEIRNNITSYVTAKRNEYTFSELGGISNLKITVTNNTDYLIDIVKVKVIYMKTNGDVWTSRIIDFNLLSPQTESTIKLGDTERGTSIEYEIVAIKSTSLGLN